MLPQKIRINYPLRRDERQWNEYLIKKKQIDSYIYINNEIIPVIRDRLRRCQLLNEWIMSNKKIYCITQNLDLTMFNQIVEVLHGGVIEITTMKELTAFVDIADYLRERTLLELIQEFIHRDIQKYEIFCLLQLAYRFGLQRIFTTLIQYLELDQFQQIKYNKFDFLQCEFELFQIILRRHHVMKIQGKIQGIQSQDIHDVINTYCYRQRIPYDITSKLIQIYVKSIDNIKPHKNQLLLDKLIDGKPMLESANFQTDCGLAQNTFRNLSQGCSFYIDCVKNNKMYMSRKYTYIQHPSFKGIDMNLNDISINFKEEESIRQNKQRKEIKKQNKNILDVTQKIFNDNSYRNIHHVKSSSCDVNDSIPSLEQVCNSVIQQQPEYMASRISTLLTEYQSAIKKHQDNFSSMKKSAKSTDTAKQVNPLQFSHADRMINVMKRAYVI